LLSPNICWQSEAALQSAMRALSIRPGWIPTLEALAICCPALERLDEARAFVDQMRQLNKPSDVFGTDEGP
jgi:Flp pilus assembly protein TadD